MPNDTRDQETKEPTPTEAASESGERVPEAEAEEAATGGPEPVRSLLQADESGSTESELAKLNPPGPPLYAVPIDVEASSSVNVPPAEPSEVITLHGKARRSKPTPKQEAFCLNRVIKKLSQRKAYREAYDADKMSDKAVDTEASLLEQTPVVARRMLELERAQEGQVLHSAARTRAFVQQRLRHEAEFADQAGARVRALELLGKVTEVGMFTDRIEQVTDESSPEELEARLDELLTRHLTGENTA